MVSILYFASTLLLFLQKGGCLTSRNLASRLRSLEVCLDAEGTLRRAEVKLLKDELKYLQDALNNDTLYALPGGDPGNIKCKCEGKEPEEKHNLTSVLMNAFADEKLLNARVRRDVADLETTVIDLLTDQQKVVTNISVEISSLRSEIMDTQGEKSCDDKMQQLDERIERLSETVNTILDVVKIDYSKYESCQDLLSKGKNISGVYEIYPNGRITPFRVYCDQNTDGGGWIVIQRREDGTVDFYRGWLDYKFGFGNVEGEFWLGNEYIHELTRSYPFELRIDMEDFEKTKKYAKYADFQIGTENENYILNVGEYTGDAGNSLSGHNKHPFFTKDRDNSRSCSQQCKGAWWYINCHSSNLNGLYHHGQHESYADGINWQPWHGFHYSLKFVEMKVR